MRREEIAILILIVVVFTAGMIALIISMATK